MAERLVKNGMLVVYNIKCHHTTLRKTNNGRYLIKDYHKNYHLQAGCFISHCDINNF